jgi:hypothetical protein
MYVYNNKLAAMSDILKFMECLYIILETGCSIKRLSVINNRITLVFGTNNDIWTIKPKSPGITSKTVDTIYTRLEELNVITRSEWQQYKTAFRCGCGHCSCGGDDGNDAVSVDTAAAAAAPPCCERGKKNIVIMKFILNAMETGWRVRKSLTRCEYKFIRNHNMQSRYLSGNFLSRFLEQNIK